MGIPTRYNPKEVENKWFEFWNSKGYFHTKISSEKKPYCIVIPPPNVTGILHMGHALNNTIQDVLIRYKRMKGFNALWVPGTDHAGIATQNVVERELLKEGKTRHDLGREEFIEKVWAWTERNGETIIEQLKKLGCSCDWQHKRFTLDKEYSKAVNKVFIKLYNEKLIYRGSYIINWCPRCQTALSDEEAPHKEIQGNLYYIKYPLKDSKEFVVVATTRPETMFGDTALAVNPKDERFKHLIGKYAILPIAERKLEIIGDEVVNPEFGTGIVKVTPFHDPNDFDIGNRHGLKGILCIDPDGKMNINATEKYDGLDRFEARESLIEDLRERKLLEKIKPHMHAVGHCYRCHTMIEPYFSEQWFVRMKPLSIKALDAAKDGKIKFYPKRWLKIYINWMENIKDWCISRQIWWGHRIPAWYCEKCYQKYLKKRKAKELKLPLEISDEEMGIVTVGEEKPKVCKRCNSKKIKQDPDVLDTWFSSWLWPFAVFGWPKATKDLEYFYPTSSLITASEIIFFWVARMIMAGFHFMGEKPFSDVYIHGTVRDDRGRKMSKSLGNAIDPLKIINTYGADTLRFSLIFLPGEDLYLSEKKMEFGRNFINKLWNASRFILMNLDKTKSQKISLEKIENLLPPKENYLVENWIISELNQLIKDIDRLFKSYRFNEIANKLYDFFWHKFCDWYIEIAKLNIKNKITQNTLLIVLKTTLKLLHPFIPFATEEIWQRLPLKKEDSIMISSWPEADEKFISLEVKKQFEECIMKPIKYARDYRRNHNISLSVTIPQMSIDIRNPSMKDIIVKYENTLKRLANIGKIIRFVSQDYTPGDIYINVRIPWQGLIDKRKEETRLNEQIEKKTVELQRITEEFANKTFLEKAPETVQKKKKDRLEEVKSEIKNLKQALKELK
jgi:valyl-tRNA synthetase